MQFLRPMQFETQYIQRTTPKNIELVQGKYQKFLLYKHEGFYSSRAYDHKILLGKFQIPSLQYGRILMSLRFIVTLQKNT